MFKTFQKLTPLGFIEIILCNDTYDNLIETQKNVQVKILSILQMLDELTDYKANSKDVKGLCICNTSKSRTHVSYFISAYTDEDENNLFKRFNCLDVYFVGRYEFIEALENENSVNNIINAINDTIKISIEQAKKIEGK